MDLLILIIIAIVMFLSLLGTLKYFDVIHEKTSQTQQPNESNFIQMIYYMQGLVVFIPFLVGLYMVIFYYMKYLNAFVTNKKIMMSVIVLIVALYLLYGSLRKRAHLAFLFIYQKVLIFLRLHIEGKKQRTLSLFFKFFYEIIILFLLFLMIGMFVF